MGEAELKNLIEQSGRHEAQIQLLIQGQRDVWDNFKDINKSLGKIAVATACIPELLSEFKQQCERIDALEQAETIRKGEAQQSQKINRWMVALAGFVGAVIGPLIEWVKSFKA